MWLLDRLSNMVSALGTAKDKSVYSRFNLTLLDAAELYAMYRSDWLARKIVDIIPHDMTREWRRWQAEDGQIEKIEEAERVLGLRRKVAEAMQRARLRGGAGLYIGTGDVRPEDELTPDRLGRGGIRYLHVLSRDEITSGEIIRDVQSPFFGRPSYYELRGDGLNVRIHPSRLVPFIGAPILDQQIATSDPWGDSILQVVYDAIQNSALAQQTIAALIPEAKIDVIKVPGLSETLATSQGTTLLTQRFTLMNQLKSSINAILLEGDGQTGESWEQKTINFTQFPELMRLFLQVAAGAADIPVTRLLGQSPSGLNATGDADIRNYYDNLSSRQEVELRPALSQLDELLIRHALGSRPPEVHYEWAPLWQLDEPQKADMALKKAQATQIYVDSALIPLDALAKAVLNQLTEDGTYPGIEAAIEESPEELGAVPDPQEAAAAEQMSANVVPIRGAATADAEPRTLYVRRDVVNKADLVKWAKDQGFDDVVPDLHVTIAYSRTPVDWFTVGTSWSDKLDIAAGGPRQMAALGPEGDYLALLFTANELVWRNREIREAGASWDWPDYQPHISIQIGGNIDLDEVEPYQGKIVLGPEIFEEVRTGEE